MSEGIASDINTGSKDTVYATGGGENQVWVPRTLRVSLTDRCSLRCSYCMPENIEFIPHAKILRIEELISFVDYLRPFGLETVRITGGEPLIRRGVLDFVRMVHERSWLKKIGMTTNGLHLLDLSDRLWEAGLRSLNVSLDAMQPDVFEAMTRRRGLQTVLVGIKRAVRKGFALKLNAVLIKGKNDAEFDGLVDFAAELDIPIRFIEYMPFGSNWERKLAVDSSELVRLAEKKGSVTRLSEEHGHTTRFVLKRPDGKEQMIGFIPALSEPFCDRCDRMRITSTGTLLSCMFSTSGIDLRTALQAGDKDTVEAAIKQALQDKPSYLKRTLDSQMAARGGLHGIGG